MTSHLQLQQIILERTEALRLYALKPDASDFYINRENALLAQLTQIYNELGVSMIHHSLWREVEEAWFYYQKSDSEFCGIMLTIRLKPYGILHSLPLNFYEYGV
jgi:hypothetical protein